MTDQSNPGHRQRYIEFRFEQSLRRYQPPPRKLIKPNQSVCKNCYRKSCESGRQNRLIRLCETRRIYHATSREKASEYSRRKQAIPQSVEKASGHVSDFNCNQNIQSNRSIAKQSDNSNTQKINFTIKSIQLRQQDNKIKWSINIKQTPIKQSIRLDLQNMGKEQELDNQMIDQKKQENNINVCKVKDIQFHIGLVEQLHQKILNQYSKIENQQVNVNTEQFMQQKREQTIQEQKNNQFQNKQQKVSIQAQDQEFQVANNIKNDNMKFFQGNEEKRVQIPNQQNVKQNKQEQNCCLQINVHVNKHNQKQVINFSDKNQQDNLKHQNKTGRILVQGQKGSCFLSARILNKLLSNNKSPNQLTSTVVRHHPYLGDVTHVFQIFSQKKMKP